MEQYNATLVLDVAADLDLADRILDALPGFGTNAGSDPHGRAEVHITLTTRTLEEAASTAVKVTERAAGARVIVLEVLTTREFDLRAQQPFDFPETIGVSDAAELIGISRQRAQQLVKDGTFARRYAGNTTVLLLAEVRSYKLGRDLEREERSGGA